MKSKIFIAKALEVATKFKTLYVMGCFGAPMNATNKARYTTNNDYNRQPSRQAMINAASSDTFGFDCVCFLKGLLWGWNGNVNHVYGGATYKSNGVPDVNANTMMTDAHCTGITTDFRNIVPGAFVWLTGHIGVYIGDGLVVECTPAWKNNVQITVLANISNRTDYPRRSWTRWGRSKYIDYSDQSGGGGTVTPPTGNKTVEELAREVIAGVWGNNPQRKAALEKAGYDYNAVQKRVNEILKEGNNSGSTNNQFYPKPDFSKFPKLNPNSIVDCLKMIGVDSSFINRLKIANKNGITAYLGTSSQNVALLNKLKNGTLIRA